MKELYFINLIGNMNIAAWIIFGLLCFAEFVVGIGYLIEGAKDESMKRISKRITIVAAICLVLGIFLPTKQDAYIIYGIGSVVDYIQDMEKIIELCSRVCFQKMPPHTCGIYPYFMPICNTSRHDCYDTLGEICEILSDEIDEHKKNIHEKTRRECEEENEKMRHMLSVKLPEYLRKLKPNNYGRTIRKNRKRIT